MIVKVQVVLAGSDLRPGRGLVYGKGRRHPVEQPLPKHVMVEMGKRAKAFFEADWSEEGGMWTIKERAEAQDW